MGYFVQFFGVTFNCNDCMKMRNKFRTKSKYKNLRRIRGSQSRKKCANMRTFEAEIAQKKKMMFAHFPRSCVRTGKKKMSIRVKDIIYMYL